jgi:hypothetical protein
MPFRKAKTFARKRIITFLDIKPVKKNGVKLSNCATHLIRHENMCIISLGTKVAFYK